MPRSVRALFGYRYDGENGHQRNIRRSATRTLRTHITVSTEVAEYEER